MKWLLIDSCGAEASLALGEEDLVLAEEILPGRGFSSGWPAALRSLLQQVGMALEGLQVIGVVRGPGSFTGVRVGLAVAKGLCESLSIPLIALSRLEVLHRYGGSAAVLDAGRDEFYIRDAHGERVISRDSLASISSNIVTTDQRVLTVLHGRAQGITLTAASALPLLLERFEASDFADLGAVDANYVRGESDMYASGKGSRPCPAP